MKLYFKKAALLAVILLFSINLSAQVGVAGRAVNTIIVDALNELPASSQERYNLLMEDIASTGQQGTNILLEMLVKKDGSYVPVQYALNGLSSYASTESFDSKKKEALAESLKSYMKKIGDSDLELKEFFTQQLETLGYITAVERINPIISKKEASKELKTANSKTRKDDSYENRAAKCAALCQLVEVTGVEENSKVLLKAIDGDCREYRFAALNAISSDPKPIVKRITKALPKYSNEAKVDVLYWLGEAKCQENAATVIEYLSSPDFEVAESAAWAVTKIGTEEGMKAIANYLTSTDDRLVSLGEACLKSYPGNVPSVVVPLYPDLNVNGQVAVINLIAQREVTEDKDIVLNALKADSSDLKAAAYKALQSISRDGKIDLYRILESAELDYIADVQAAIMVSLSELCKEKQYEALLQKKDQASTQGQSLYWPMIVKCATLEQLLNICESTSDKNLFELAFNAYVSSVKRSKVAGVQKLLELRNIMEVAKNDAEKIAVLNGVSATNSFLGIIFAGQYIEVPALRQAAATAVRKIALGNKSFNGPEVVALLKRAAEVLDGPDAQYEITAINKHLAELPEAKDGFVSIFNGKNLDGWQGLVGNPISRGKMKTKALEKAQKEADEKELKNWVAEDGEIVFLGKGNNLCTKKMYGDFEMYVDWLLYPEGPEADAGIYLRGAPQVQIWDTSRVNVGAQVGSGGLYNNQKNPSKPLCVADNKLGEWNSFYIKMVGERVTILLNGILVVDNVILENYWNRAQPIFPKEAIELQAHGSKVAYRNLYVKELEQVKPYELSAEEKKEGFEILFDGTSLHNWQGNTTDYSTQDGTIAVVPTGQGVGNLYTKKEYEDFIFRFEFKLTPGANNGVGIRTPLGSNAAYDGMEIQILDHYDDIYKNVLVDYQYHGSVYGIIPTQNRDALKPLGEWNVEEIYIKGSYIKVTLNGVVITEGDLVEATENGTYDGEKHPGLFNKTGYIGFLGHGSELWLRNIRIKEL